MKRTLKRILWIVAGLAVVGLIVISMMPKPIAVDIAAVERGAMMVTVDAEGTTRVNNLYTVAAPVGGELDRIELEEGATVLQGAIVATIHPTEVTPAQKQETEARIGAVQAGVRSAEAAVDQARTQLEQARRERDRLVTLVEAGAVPRQQLETAEDNVRTLEDQVEAAKARASAAAMEVAAAKTGRAAYSGTGATITVTAPATGSVLRVYEKSERVVPPGTPLVAIGDPTSLEIVVDVLSSDAVRIEPGNRIVIDGWGGEEALEGKVMYVEPSATTKISALGIEEQRVNVVGVFSQFPDRLGDGYRVVAHIVTWEGRNVLRVPASALFRDDGSWNVFVVEEGAARKRKVQIGHRNAFEVEITSGLDEKESVILHPSNQIRDGIEVAERKS